MPYILTQLSQCLVSQAGGGGRALTFWASRTAVEEGGCLVFLCQQSFLHCSKRD